MKGMRRAITEQSRPDIFGGLYNPALKFRMFDDFDNLTETDEVTTGAGQSGRWSVVITDTASVRAGSGVSSSIIGSQVSECFTNGAAASVYDINAFDATVADREFIATWREKLPAAHDGAGASTRYIGAGFGGVAGANNYLRAKFNNASGSGQWSLAVRGDGAGTEAVSGVWVDPGFNSGIDYVCWYRIRCTFASKIAYFESSLDGVNWTTRIVFDWSGAPSIGDDTYFTVLALGYYTSRDSVSGGNALRILDLFGLDVDIARSQIPV